MKTKTHPYLIFLLLFILPFFTINAQIKDTLVSYVRYNLNGPQINGSHTIEIGASKSNNQVTNMVIPDGPNSSHKITEIDYMDIDQEGGAYFKIPAQEGLIELTKLNRDDFSFSIFIDNKNLKAKSVSFHILEVVEDKIMKMRLSLIKGRFEGVMEYIYNDNGEHIESYTVHGTFQYISPMYERKLKRKNK